jgi:hypothetical protein
MLRTNVQKSQLKVTVDGKEAVCKNLDCDYIYVAPVGEITSFSFDASTNKVTINGDLSSIVDPTTDIRSIEFAKSKCALDDGSFSSSSLTCTLEQTKTCGSHLPILTTKKGIIPVQSSVATEDIDCSISSVIPSTEINLLGFDNLTISGTNLPSSIHNNEISIVFTDTQSTKCIPQVSSTTELVCLTQPFDKVASPSQSYGMVITINGL